MADYPKPKVLLFDIGGVCVISPFKAILEYELTHNIPPGYINYSISLTSPNGAWHRLERGEIPCTKSSFFEPFRSDLTRPDIWRTYHQQKRLTPTPPLPEIDAESLFWAMMSASAHPDPYMYPALLKLRESGEFCLAALSNTSIFPDDAPIKRHAVDVVKEFFGVFVSSAHVGMRKPERRIYEYTMERLRERYGEELKEGEVVFLDDIGENLKMGRSMGWRTIRVWLGRTREAVVELEKMTSLKLLVEEEDDRKAKL